jgi:penicillin G amidase
MASIQMDVGSAFVAAILPRLLKIHPADNGSATALALLGRWNKLVTMDAPQPLIFNSWMRQFRANILAANGVADARTPAPMDFVAFVLGEGQGAWCGGDCDALLSRSLAEVVATIPGDPPSWRWGNVHRAIFPHPIFGRLPLVGSLFRFAISDPGDDSTVDRGVSNDNSWNAVQGPSFRGVYDLADLDASRFMIAPGQSGNPFSSHATNLLHDWRDGTTLALPPMPPESAARLTLVPDSP